jgi:hypothetical protein
MNDTLFPLRPGGAAAVLFTICSVRAGFRVKYFLRIDDSRLPGKCHMPAVAYKERPHRQTHPRPEPRPPQRRTEHRPQQQLKTFHARLSVTRAEEWWVEAHSAEEAQGLLAAGQGHHAALGERLHVEVEEMLED